MTEELMSVDDAVYLAEQQSADVVLTDEEGDVPVCKMVVRGDYSTDEKSKQAHITEEGHQKVEDLMHQSGLLGDGESLSDPANIRLVHPLNAALRAHAIYNRDIIHFSCHETGWSRRSRDRPWL